MKVFLSSYHFGLKPQKTTITTTANKQIKEEKEMCIIQL